MNCLEDGWGWNLGRLFLQDIPEPRGRRGFFGEDGYTYCVQGYKQVGFSQGYKPVFDSRI